jgi:hypothetical protein
MSYSLEILEWDAQLTSNSAVQTQAYPAPLQRLAVRVMINGRPDLMLSPCGANCSYQIEFEGPYLKCDHDLNENTNMYMNNSDIVQIYRGQLNVTMSERDDPKFSAFKYNSAVLHTPTRLEGSIITVTTESLLCRPYRALYTVKNRYINNVHEFNISATPISRLVNLIPLDGDQGLPYYDVPGFSESTDGPVAMMNGTAKGFGNIPASWSQAAKDWYRDVNIINIIGSSLSPIVGGYTARAVSLDKLAELSPNKKPDYMKNIVYVDQYAVQAIGLELDIQAGTYFKLSIIPNLFKWVPTLTHVLQEQKTTL